MDHGGVDEIISDFMKKIHKHPHSPHRADCVLLSLISKFTF